MKLQLGSETSQSVKMNEGELPDHYHPQAPMESKRKSSPEEGNIMLGLRCFSKNNFKYNSKHTIKNSQEHKQEKAT